MKQEILNFLLNFRNEVNASLDKLNKKLDELEVIIKENTQILKKLEKIDQMGKAKEENVPKDDLCLN